VWRWGLAPFTGSCAGPPPLSCGVGRITSHFGCGVTSIYQLRPDVDRFRWLTLVEEQEFNLLHDLPDGPTTGSWRPLAAEWIADDLNSGKPTSDFPTLGSTPVFSQRAVDALIDVLVPHGELLPLRVPDGSFYIYNATHVIDALDEERSELVRFSSGRVMHVASYAFKTDVVQGEAIFKVPQLRGTVFVSNGFSQRIREADLSGFALRPL
jgi:hypothetical protein